MLSHLPPYLPPNAQELVAEIAVLEEEVTRLEEQVVIHRQSLYQEAVFICSKRKSDNPMEYFEQIMTRASRESRSDLEESPTSVVRTVSVASDQSSQSLGRLSDHPEQNLGDLLNENRATNDITSTDDILERCKSSGIQSHESSRSLVNSSKTEKRKENVQFPDRKLSRVKTPLRKSSFKRQPSEKSLISPQEQPVNKALGGDSEPNKVSEDTLKCLCSIFTRMSYKDEKTTQSSCPLPFVSDQDFETQDPYGTGAEFKARDIGVYKFLWIVDANSIDLKWKKKALFLLHKLKLLLGKLAKVNLDGLSHQHKLAFWINTYNSCMMNAFLEHGIPDSPEKVVLLMREATITVGGQKMTAITIEHFILRLPFYVKQGGKRAAKGNDLKASNMFGLEGAEPLVTFALSCGSWSSPAVRVYTASQIESELEAAKKEYIQAVVGITKDNKFTIPKLLDWYQLEFAKDLSSLLEWVCLQLPDKLKKEALCFLETTKDVPFSELLDVVPYDFSFRYLIHA
ncbi:uncharacterized protein LOC141598706 [Silene latifolia]|uniref:uncharacterized protein LOC141598706 n=1 Tax=Silene latifolia TaxID=37657 RepID=UPI003D780D29